MVDSCRKLTCLGLSRFDKPGANGVEVPFVVSLSHHERLPETHVTLRWRPIRFSQQDVSS
jgi:hypothetical protein